MVFGPIAPHWINIDDNNITVEGCLLYLLYRIGPCPGCNRTFIDKKGQIYAKITENWKLFVVLIFEHDMVKEMGKYL